MTETITQVLNELRIIKEKQTLTDEELESLKTTLDIMSNPETMKSIEISMKEIREGKYTKFTTFKDLLDEVDGLDDMGNK